MLHLLRLKMSSTLTRQRVTVFGLSNSRKTVTTVLYKMGIARILTILIRQCHWVQTLPVDFRSRQLPVHLTSKWRTVKCHINITALTQVSRYLVQTLLKERILSPQIRRATEQTHLLGSQVVQPTTIHHSQYLQRSSLISQVNGTLITECFKTTKSNTVIIIRAK